MRSFCLKNADLPATRRSRLIGVMVMSCVLAAVFVLGLAMNGSTSGSSGTSSVTIICEGNEWEYATSQRSVEGALNEAGVAFGSKDRIYPGLKNKLVPGMRIRVVRVTEKVIVQNEPIRYKTVAKFSPYSRTARSVVQQGIRGEKKVTYLVTYKDGVKTTTRVLDSVVTRNPQNEIVAVSASDMIARGGHGFRTLRMMATAYDPSGGNGYKYGGRTATGRPARKGVVAVDPRVIRLGTKLYVEGYGYCIAADTGGAIKGNRIDLCYNTYGEAIRFGRRYVTVYVLE